MNQSTTIVSWVLCIRCLPCPCMCLEEPLLSPFHQAALWRSPVCPPDRSLRSNASLSTGESESPSYSAKNNWTCHNPEEPEGCLKFEHEKWVHEFDLFWISRQKEHAPYSTWWDWPLPFYAVLLVTNLPSVLYPEIHSLSSISLIRKSTDQSANRRGHSVWVDNQVLSN